MIKQSYFLLRSVKYNGNKKCICFFTTIEATNIFSNILSQLAKLCNLDINIQIIVNDIKQKERALRIKQFIETESLAFLLSVHILDEGIDIPECDSVFVAKPDEDIDNLVQRISRCNRMIEGKNLSTTYLWCGYRKLKSILDTINKKFVCKIPKNIMTMHVEINKVIVRPYDKIKKIQKDKIIEDDIDCEIRDNDIWCNKKNICEMIGVTELTEQQNKDISEYIDTNNIDEYDENNITSIKGDTYISMQGLKELINSIENEDIKKSMINKILKILFEKDNIELIIKFVNIIEKIYICFDFDLLAKWIYVNKSNLKRLLISKFKKITDYAIKDIIIPRNNKTAGATRKEEILLSPNTFKHLCVLSRTPKANQIIPYFI